MQVEAQKIPFNFPPGSPHFAPLGINTESAHIRSGVISEKPRQSRVCGQSAIKDENLIKAEKEARARRGLRFRHFLAMRQRQAIYEAGLAENFKSLCSCGAFAIPAMGYSKKKGYYLTHAPGEVQLSLRNNSEGGSPLVHCWVKKCANPLLCFVDAPKIRWYRSQEMQKITKKLHGDGFCWLFMTFTAPHDLDTDPQFQVDRFQEAKRIFKKNWKRDFADRWGLKFYIRAVEMTDDSPGPGRKSGCHFHHHEIDFFHRDGFSDDELEEIRKFLSRRWVSALIEVGICPAEKRDAALKRAFRLDVPRRPKTLDDSDLEAVSEYLGKGASLEITPGINVKQGRKKARVTHWELMKLAFTSHPELKFRALSVMLALKGRAWLYYSPGLSDYCGLKEVSDKEILKEKNGVLVYSYDDGDWYDIDRLKGQDVLEAAIVEECRANGIDLSSLPRDPEKKGRLDMGSPKVRKVCNISDLTADFIVQTGCDPLTGESLETYSGINLKAIHCDGSP